MVFLENLYVPKPTLQRIDIHRRGIMDFFFIGTIVLFFALTWGMASACAKLGERK